LQHFPNVLFQSLHFLQGPVVLQPLCLLTGFPGQPH
jgi:hypothetical protein